MKYLISFIIFIITTQIVAFPNEFIKEWTEFKKIHNKNYVSKQEEINRMNIFLKNFQTISIHNELYYQNGSVTFRMGVNKYTDLTPEEFVQQMNGYKQRIGKRIETNDLKIKDEPVPEEIDWRDFYAVTPIKDQGDCGSCWAFSATGALESHYYLKTGTLPVLSEQNLLDCSFDYGNVGCSGGLMDSAFRYVIDHDIDTEKSYPYKAQTNEQCYFNASTIGATCNGYIDLRSGDEEYLLKTVGLIGPVSIAVDASHESFMHYQGGIYQEPDCDTDLLDHGMLLVGYGLDVKSGLKYWLVKNSWGTTWGENGYMRILRQENHCGVATNACYPVV